MNIKNKISLVSLLILGISCGAKPSTFAVTQTLRNYSVSLKEMASNQIYLNDSIDSILSDGSADAAASGSSAQAKLAAAKAALAQANSTLAKAEVDALRAVNTSKSSAKTALDLGKLAKVDASVKARAEIADAQAQVDAASAAEAVKAEADARAAQVAAADALAQAQKDALAEGDNVNAGGGAAVNDALVKAQADLKVAQDALALAQTAAAQAKADAKEAKKAAKDAAQAAVADATLQADADAAQALADAADLKAIAAADAEAAAAAEVAKAEAAVLAAGNIAAEAPAVEGDAGAVVDPVTEDDVKPKRIGQMVAQLFVTLDVNANDVLDLQEFLKIAEVKRGPGGGELNADQLAALETKLTAKFTQFAGADNLMTDVELATFLKGQKGRVGKLRKRLGQLINNRALSAEQLLAKFDANNDGVIDLAELTAMKASLAASRKAR